MSTTPPTTLSPTSSAAHSSDPVQRTPQEAARRIKMGRLKMLLVLLVCASPVLASYWAYYVLRPNAQRNYGELIQPPVDLPAASAQTLDGQPFDLAQLKGQWLLVSVGAGSCDALCERNLYLQRQMRQSLGKDKDRTDWVWLIDDTSTVNDTMREVLKEATVLRISSSLRDAWLKPQPEHDVHEHLYVIDPMGNWMMRFPADMDLNQASRARRDLERLLRASAFWDKAGR